MTGTVPTIASVLRPLGVRIIRRPIEPADEPVFAQSPPPAEDAAVVEGGKLEAREVSSATESGFTHFLDGAQKSRPAFFDGQAPGYLAHISAAILERKDRDMLDAADCASKLAVFAPESSEALRSLAQEFAGLGALCFESVRCPADAGMAAMRELVTNRISTAREELETILKTKWMRENDNGWLLADGGIAQASAAVPAATRIVGVVKSHRKQYFCAGVNADVVLNLREGERTSVFKALTGSMGRDVAYSWYLRLREADDESPVFGLVRVEMPPREESIGFADLVSGWLMQERAPLSLPDNRYDRMVYPIRRVELYLKSLQPSDAALAGMVGV